MIGFPVFPDHDEPRRQGHGEAATRASVESALHAAGDLDAREIIVSTLGADIVLEGFVRRHGDVERAAEITESIVGRGHEHNRLLRR